MISLTVVATLWTCYRGHCSYKRVDFDSFSTLFWTCTLEAERPQDLSVGLFRLWVQKAKMIPTMGKRFPALVFNIGKSGVRHCAGNQATMVFRTLHILKPLHVRHQVSQNVMCESNRQDATAQTVLLMMSNLLSTEVAGQERCWAQSYEAHSVAHRTCHGIDSGTQKDSCRDSRENAHCESGRLLCVRHLEHTMQLPYVCVYQLASIAHDRMPKRSSCVPTISGLIISLSIASLQQNFKVLQWKQLHVQNVPSLKPGIGFVVANAHEVL